jgi:hypothetical protein
MGLGAGQIATQDDIKIASGSQPIFQAFLTANQTLTTSTITALLFSTEALDDRGWHSVSVNTSRVTPDLPGRYLVNVSANFVANATGARRVYGLKNGATNHVFSVIPVVTANQVTVAASGIIVCNGTTDYIEGAAFHSVGANLDVVGGGDATFSTFLEVTYLGNYS